MRELPRCRLLALQPLPRPKRLLYTEDYRRLEAEVPNLVGTKFTGASPAEAYELVTQTELPHFLGERNFPFGCLHGECSLLAAWGPLFPRKIRELFDHGVEGRFEKLFRLSAEITRVTKTFMGPTRDLERINGAFDKMIVRAGGADMPLRMLSPYEGIDLETFDACVTALRKSYPDWLQ